MHLVVRVCFSVSLAMYNYFNSVRMCVHVCACLRVAHLELAEQVEGLVEDVIDASAGPVDLVDHQHRLDTPLERLLQHETRLRFGPCRGACVCVRACVCVPASARSTSAVLFMMEAPTNTHA